LVNETVLRDDLTSETGAFSGLDMDSQKVIREMTGALTVPQRSRPQQRSGTKRLRLAIKALLGTD
jgi:hypothetical protein